MNSHDELGEEYKRDMTVRTAVTDVYHIETVKQNPDNCAIYGVAGPSSVIIIIVHINSREVP